MTLGERIKQRRTELGLSQAELATLLNYGDRSTIAKIESGKNDITQSKIVLFADTLKNTFRCYSQSCQVDAHVLFRAPFPSDVRAAGYGGL